VIEFSLFLLRQAMEDDSQLDFGDDVESTSEETLVVMLQTVRTVPGKATMGNPNVG